MSEIGKKSKQQILRILRDSGAGGSSREVCRQLAGMGVELSPRTVRLYLQELEDEGLVAAARRGRSGGRNITSRGIEEIENAGTVERLGFIVARIEQLSYRMTYHPRLAPDGTVILNLTIVDVAQAVHALREMSAVFQAGLGMGEYVGLFSEGEKVSGTVIPAGCFGIGTVCSVTLNGILLRSGVPVSSEFGAVLELREGRPFRFTELITYSGTTLDPLEIFIKAGLSKVHAAAISGNGLIGASFRQFPADAMETVQEVRNDLQSRGLDGILCFGRAGDSLLDFPVHEGRIALVVGGGLNPAAAVEEAGIPTRSRALTALFPVADLIHYREMQERALAILSSKGG